MTPGRLPLKLWASMIQEHGIEVVVTGDMDLVGTMQRNWIEECGEECGVDACLPLWQADRAELLRKLSHEVRLLSVDAPSRLQGRPGAHCGRLQGFKFVFSCVKTRKKSKFANTRVFKIACRGHDA